MVALVGCWWLRRCLILNCNRPRSVGGSGGCLGRLLSAVVGYWRLRRCLIVNSNRSRSVKGCGGCVGRLLAAAVLSDCKLQ